MSIDIDEQVTTADRRPARRAVSLSELQSSGEIRVLVVDDETEACRLIEAALSSQDFRIDTVSDPSAIEEKLFLRADPDHAGYYHLIIMDYVLPGLENEQVMEWIRVGQPNANVVVVTGYPSVESALNCLRARTYDYLTKPFKIETLREVVVRCLEAKGLLRMTEDALRENLGATIRERRKALGFTLAEMSRRTDVSLGYLSQIELGKNSASIETLYRISLALGTKLSELFLAVQRQ